MTVFGATDRRVVAAVALAAGATLGLAGYVYLLDGVLIGAGDGPYLAKAGAINLAVYAPLALVALLLPSGVPALLWLWFAFTVGFMGARAVTLGLRARGDGWLVVDDLVDTGNTATIIRNMLPKAHFATLYSKPAGKPLVDTFITEVSQDTWILFPWDSEVQYTAPLVEQN